jgi:hypothetical protein
VNVGYITFLYQTFFGKGKMVLEGTMLCSGAHVAILAFSMTKRKLALAFTPAKERSPGEANFPAAGEESPKERTATDPRP